MDETVPLPGFARYSGIPRGPAPTHKIMKGYYELKKAGDGKFQFTLHAANHEIILVSQLYPAKADAEKGIESVRNHGPHEARFERKLSALGEPYFSLKAPNGQIIGTSEMYGSEASRDNGVRSVAANSPTTVVRDQAENPG